MAKKRRNKRDRNQISKSSVKRDTIPRDFMRINMLARHDKYRKQKSRFLPGTLLSKSPILKTNLNPFIGTREKRQFSRVNITNKMLFVKNNKINKETYKKEVCKKRFARREVMFANNKAGIGRKIRTPKILTEDSKIKC